MKKFLLAIIVAASLASAVPAGAQEKSVDLIVLLDASQSMFPYFTDVVDFVVSRIARDYLRFGDTFHLLTFTDTAQIEIVQAVKTEQDIKRLLGRLYLLYPLGKNTDLLSALTNLYRYTSDLPEASRKLIIMVTDGMHNPSSQSPYAGLGTEEVRAGIEKTASRIRENGWTIRIVRIPFDDGASTVSAAGTSGSSSLGAGGPGTGSPGAGPSGEALGSSPGAGDYLSDVAAGLGAPVTDFTTEGRENTALLSVEIPKATFPGPLGKVGYSFSFPLGLFNSSSRDLRLELSGVYFQGENILRKSIFIDLPGGSDQTIQIPVDLPLDLEPGSASVEVELRFAEGVRVAPTVGTLSFELASSPLARVFRTTGRAVLFLILLAAALGLILFLTLYIRGLHKRAEQPVVAAVLDSEAAAAEERRRALSRTPVEKAAYVSPEEARALREGIVSKHITREEAEALRAGLAPKHISQEEARIFAEARTAITDEEASRFSASRALTDEEALRYRNDSSRNAAEALAAFAASTSPLRPEAPQPGRPSSFTPIVKRTGSLRVEFRVEDQNPYVGSRNIHTLHSGGRKTLGGGRSDFLVFLVPVPARTAEVYFDGEDITLVPCKAEYFPDYNGPVEGCLHKSVRMVTRSGRALTLRFTRYVPPAESINRLLHCVDVPGFAFLEPPAGLGDKESEG